MGQKQKQIDPRTGLGLLLAANIIAFSQSNIWMEAGWLIAVAVLMLVCKRGKSAAKCLMVGSLMIHTISLREMIFGMRTLHVPQKLIIPIAVTLRYFPAIKEETGHICDAMKLRNVRGLDKIEALVVPLMISASATAEELSAAAVTRGIENPVKKTSLVQLKMTALDYISLFAAVLFVVMVLVW